jgi:hypothetical protein
MLGKDFRSLAEAVTGTYGNDPWFFLRELAQNSRDAGAQSIWVNAERTADPCAIAGKKKLMGRCP